MPIEQTSFPIQRRSVAIVPGSANDEDNTIEVVWTTGVKVRRYDWGRDRYYQEELVVSEEAIRLERLNDGASVLDSHQSYSIHDILGVTEKAWVANGEGRAKLLMDVGDDKAANTWRKIKEGLIRHISVGYSIHAVTEIREGDEITLRATDWEPHEISFVPVGADAGAGVRSEKQLTIPCKITRADDGTSPPEGDTMANQQNSNEAEAGANTPAESGETRNQPAPQAPSVVTPATVPEGDAGSNDQSRSQDNHATEIMQMCELVGADIRTANDFIRRGIPPDQVRSHLLANKATQSEDGQASQHQSDGGQRAQEIDHGAIYRNYNGQR